MVLASDAGGLQGSVHQSLVLGTHIPGCRPDVMRESAMIVARLVTTVLLMMSAAAPVSALDEANYPSRQIRIVVGFAAGSEPLFAEWVGPLITPRRVIEHVIAGKIDVGPLDSYVHDLLKRNEPEATVRLRTVESTAMT